MTGEPDDLKKTKHGDCFLLSSSLLVEGEEVRALVIGIGTHSQWGKIKANLASEAVNTPLQDKLEQMTTQVYNFVKCYKMLTQIADSESLNISLIDWILGYGLGRVHIYCFDYQYLGSSQWRKCC